MAQHRDRDGGATATVSGAHMPMPLAGMATSPQDLSSAERRVKIWRRWTKRDGTEVPTGRVLSKLEFEKDPGCV